MTFLQAAPDEMYFTWQYAVQALNYREFDLEKDMVILVGLKKGNAPSDHIKNFESWFRGKVHYYEDTRETTYYLSSIRPHLIKKYLKDNPTKVFMYQDQDIIWLKNPELDKYIDDPYCYLAKQAQGYTYARYLKGFHAHIFPEMCRIIGVDPQLVEDNDDNCGGAQYIIKDTDYDFWDKCEKDCETLYKFLFDTTREDAKNKVYHVQIWAADMWVLFWNLLLAGKQVRHLQEINFTWPYDTFESAQKNNYFIMHNAGIDHTNDHDIYFNISDKSGILRAENTRKEDFHKDHSQYDFVETMRKRRYFNKGVYRNKFPYEDDHSYLKPEYLQTKYVSYFKQLKEHKPVEKKKILAIWNSSHGRTQKKIHPELIQKSLECLKKAADNAKLVNVEVVTSAWVEIPNNPFKHYITPFNNMGHLNYILQMKQQLVNHTADIVSVIEHDTLIPDNYFDEVITNWNYGRYTLSNRNYIGINTTGYLDVLQRHHPFSTMSFAKFYLQEQLNKGIDECLQKIGDFQGTATYGWCLLEPDDKGHEFWSSKPMIHVSGQGLGEFNHNFTSHDTVCYERDSKGKVYRPDWGNYLELLPFLNNYKN